MGMFRKLRKRLPPLLKELQVRTMLDLPAA